MDFSLAEWLIYMAKPFLRCNDFCVSMNGDQSEFNVYTKWVVTENNGRLLAKPFRCELKNSILQNVLSKLNKKSISFPIRMYVCGRNHWHIMPLNINNLFHGSMNSSEFSFLCFFQTIHSFVASLSLLSGYNAEENVSSTNFNTDIW